MKAFTMAEILLSLTIIGVVAAITLPSLTGNINERTWNTQRKALYARMSQAISLMPALNGYGTLVEGNDSTSAIDNATETFVINGLAKVLKINNICDNEHLQDCGIPQTYTTLVTGSTISSIPSTLAEFNDIFTKAKGYNTIDTKAAAFETQNGESILAYYNPNCTSDMQELTHHSVKDNMCANFIYDLNGNKGPNTVGKDIGFITVLYPTDSVVVAPIPLNKTAIVYTQQTKAGDACRKQDEYTRQPNVEELIAMAFNNKPLMGNTEGQVFTSNTVVYSKGIDYVWAVGINSGNVDIYSRSGNHSVWCIKR